MIRRVFDKRFRTHWSSYVLQSIFAAISVFLVLIALRQQNLVVAASLAATAFTIFAMPSSVTASTRNVILGHIIGLAFGSLFAIFLNGTALMQDFMYAFAVGGAMLTMAITNSEHPPAAGTALGVVINGFSFRIVLGVIIGVLVLAIIHRLLRPILRDLVRPPEQANSDITKSEE